MEALVLLLLSVWPWFLAFAAAPPVNQTYTIPPNVRLRDGDTFEYIVVGAGAAGSAAAARLALAGRRVLLVEAGGDPDLRSMIPGAAQTLLGSDMDYHYETITNSMSCLAYKNRQCTFSRGKCLGGSTSINYMMYTRGNPQDFSDLGIPGWTWDDMKPYFLRYEGLQSMYRLPKSSMPYHNTSGEMKLEFFDDSENRWHSRLIDSFRRLHFPRNPDVNAESQIGVSQVVGYVYENERMSTARGFLSRKDVKQRLKVAKNTKCTGVIIGEDNVARGITVIRSSPKRKLSAAVFPRATMSDDKQLKLYATKEVILSAGAIATPQILMLSGIGHAEHLTKFNIPVVSDLPVGDNMTDHVLPLLFVKVDKVSGRSARLINASKKVTQLAELLFLKSGPLTSNGLTDITAFLNSNCYDFVNHRLENNNSDCEVPTLQYIHSYIDRNLLQLSGSLFQKGTGLNDAVTQQLAQINKDYAFLVLSPQVLQPYSQGTVRLASADPLDAPEIFPNFLSDERDVQEMVRAITIVEHLMQTPAFSEQKASIVRLELPGCPQYDTNPTSYWACYSRHMTHTSFHATGTTSVGGVLDARLRVHGVRALRVADLGALPRVPRGNTAAAAIAIGEKVADLILTNR